MATPWNQVVSWWSWWSWWSCHIMSYLGGFEMLRIIPSPQLLWTPISDSASLASWNWQAIPPRDSPWLSVNSRCEGACSLCGLCGLCQPQRFMMVHVFHGILLRNGKWHERPAGSLWLYGFPWVPHRFHRHGNDQLAILPMSRLSPRLWWWIARKAIPGMSEVMSEVISDMSEFKPG